MKALYPALAAVCGLFAAANSLFAQGSTSFASSTYLTIGPARSVVAVDINGNGKLDLISADFLATVFTNNGNGSFGIQATLFPPVEPVGFSLIGAGVADVNGDGKLDVIVSEYFLGNGVLEAFTNNGSGGFGLHSWLDLGLHIPNCMVAADVNGDGKADLICSYSTNALLLLTNDGTGVFGSNATLNVGNEPDAIAVADVNSDGKPDVICANYADDRLTVLTNGGSGVFGSNATLNVGSEPACVVAADVSGDEKLDLITANYGDDTLTVLTNNGAGAFGFNATLKTGLQPRGVIAAELYGNGELDLISANSGTNTLTILTNNGSGIFGFNATLLVGAGPSCIVAADVNHNGKLDLISANEDGTVTVLTQVTVEPPVLKVTPTATNTLVLAWSSFSPGFTLLTNSDLTGTNWAPAGDAISTRDGTNQSVSIPPPSSGSLFFRLKQ